MSQRRPTKPSRFDPEVVVALVQEHGSLVAAAAITGTTRDKLHSWVRGRPSVLARVRDAADHSRRRYTDHELLRAVEKAGSLAGAAKALGVVPATLHARLRSNPTLRVSVAARKRGHLREWKASFDYPPHAVLIEMAAEHGGVYGVARHLGVSATALYKAIPRDVLQAMRQPRPPSGGRVFYNRWLTGEARAYAETIRHDPCAYCGGVADTTDHIDAVSRGGANSWDNLTPACCVCNSTKRNTPLLLFMLKRAHGVRRLEQCV